MSTQTSELTGTQKVKILGGLMITVGIAGALFFFFGFYAAVSSPVGDVSNVSLMEDRLLGFMASLALFLAGLLLVLALWIGSKLDRS